MLALRDERGLRDQLAALNRNEVIHKAVGSFGTSSSRNKTFSTATDRVRQRIEGDIRILELELDEEEDPFA